VGRRLADDMGAGRRGNTAQAGLRRDADPTLKGLERLVAPADAKKLSHVRAWLARAGYRRASAARIYYLARSLLGLCTAAGLALLVPLLAPRMDVPVMMALAVALAAFTFFLPTLWVQYRVGTRQQQAVEGFPDALDMLLVCVEAGQGLDQAMARMAGEVGQAHPVLAEEFGLVGQELRAGKERSQVLRDLTQRLQVTDISAFVTVMIQADEYGTPIGDALRVYASEMRQKRLMNAEEKANRVPLKLAMGTMMFTVPPVVLILIGPSILMIFQSLAAFTR
jgi:tight adherence protein C